VAFSVRYKLSLPETRDPTVAATQLARLRLVSERFPFHLITPIWRFRGEECRAGGSTGLREPRDLLRLSARRRAAWADADWPEDLEPEEIQGFVIKVGRRCENLPIGLARYPAVVERRGLLYATGLPGWQWSAACNTWYASLCGLEYFVRCHQSVIAVLDQARALGFEVDVRDDGGYWEHRDVWKLLDAVERTHRKSPVVPATAQRVSGALTPP